jgi:hypothetical protein
MQRSAKSQFAGHRVEHVGAPLVARLFDTMSS